MNITVIGASAGVGLEAVKRALKRNHTVTTLSRSKITIHQNDNLKTINGSALNKSDFKKSIETADALIIALGTGKNTKPTNLYSEFAKILVEIEDKNIPIIVLTGFGAGESRHYLSNFLMKLLFRFILKDVYLDKTRMEEIISNSDLNWTIVRPGLLKNKPLTEKYKVETKLFKGIKIRSINRSDVADFMIKEAENQQYKKQYPALSNS